MEHDEWLDMYQNEKLINLEDVLNDEDFELLKKLRISVKDTMCTGSEYELLSIAVADYYEDENMTDEEKDGIKELSSVGVEKEEYSKLLRKFEMLDKKFYDILRRHI